MELPVKAMPRNSPLSPIASLNRNTKYTGNMAESPDDANAEFAKSYIHQARMLLRCRSGRSLNLMLIGRLSSWVNHAPHEEDGAGFSVTYQEDEGPVYHDLRRHRLYAHDHARGRGRLRPLLVHRHERLVGKRP